MKFESSNSGLVDSRKLQVEKTLLDKIKRWAKIAVLVSGGVSGITAGYVIVGGEIKYNKYYVTQAREYEPHKKILEEYFEEEVIKRMEDGDRQTFFHKKAEKLEPKINGFDKIGLSLRNEDFKGIWSDTNGSYPKGWIAGSVAEIDFKEHKEKFPSEYGRVFDGEESGAATHLEKRTIDFFKSDGFSFLMRKDYEKDLLSYMDSVFGHELGHLNDPETSRILNLTQRIRLYQQILDRLSSSHPYHSPQALGDPDEYAKINIPNKKKQTYLQVKEYWAEIVSDYFLSPDFLKEQSPEDYAIVDHQVKISDPSFNPFVAEKQREKIIKEIVANSRK